MDVGFTALEVIVEVVPEEVYQVYRVVPRVLARVPGEEHEGDVAHTLAGPGVGRLGEL